MSNIPEKGTALRQVSKPDVKATLAELAREELKLKLPLLDAALAGAALALHPSNPELRAHVARTRAAIRPTLEHHLCAEELTMLKWAEARSAVRHEILERIQRQHSHIRELLTAISATSFEKGAETAVAKAAHDLCDLAVSIDDMVAGEERDLLPMIRRALFAKPAANH